MNVILSQSRMMICNGCPRYHAVVKLCRECGCFMPAKTRIPSAKCPLGKWLADK